MLLVMVSVFSCRAQITQERSVLKCFFDQIPDILEDQLRQLSITDKGYLVARLVEIDTCDSDLCVLLISDSLYSLPELNDKDSAYAARVNSSWERRQINYPGYPVDSFMYNRKETINYGFKKITSIENNFLLQKAESSKRFSEYIRLIKRNRIPLGYIKMSRIYFDNNYQHAVMLYTYYGKMSGKIFMVLFDNEDGYWKVKENIVIGIF